jgi:hypothetical protein
MTIEAGEVSTVHASNGSGLSLHIDAVEFDDGSLSELLTVRQYTSECDRALGERSAGHTRAIC